MRPWIDRGGHRWFIEPRAREGEHIVYAWCREIDAMVTATAARMETPRHAATLWRVMLDGIDDCIQNPKECAL